MVLRSGAELVWYARSGDMSKEVSQLRLRPCCITRLAGNLIPPWSMLQLRWGRNFPPLQWFLMRLVSLVLFFLWEEFTVPVYDQVHQEQFAASEMTENVVDIPVVQEQVIVQAIPEVVVSLPPVEEFTVPVYDQVHQEQFAAGEMTENVVEFPVVHEQEIVASLPERLVDARGPQGGWSVRLARALKPPSSLRSSWCRRLHMTTSLLRSS